MTPLHPSQDERGSSTLVAVLGVLVLVVALGAVAFLVLGRAGNDTESSTTNLVAPTSSRPHTQTPADTVDLDGYLVSDRNGISVVSTDGATRTGLVDHPAGRAFGDGMGGILYEDDLGDGATVSTDSAHTIMWLKAGEIAPTELVGVEGPDVSLRILATGTFEDTPVLFYARHDTSSTDAEHLGAGSEIVVRDLDTGTDHRVTGAPGTDHAEQAFDFVALLASDGAVGAHHLIFQGTQGTAPALYQVDDTYQVRTIDSGVCHLDDLEADSCEARVAAPIPDDQVDFLTFFSHDSDVTTALTRADLGTAKIVSRTPVDALSRRLCDRGAAYVNADATRMVVSFAPDDNGWPGCNAILVDPTTHDTTDLGFDGLVAPLDTPVTRPTDTRSHP